MEYKNVYIDPTAVVEEGAEIGEGTKIWHFTHVMKGAKIGKNVTIGQGCFIQEGAIIGDNCKIQNGVSIYYGVELGDDVFIGPNATFTNVRKPDAEKVVPRENYMATVIRDGVTIGANATIVCGIEIGRNAFVGAGAVITKPVPGNVTVVGNPAGILIKDSRGVAFVVSFEEYYVKRIKK